ncbi:MAG: rhomboid family intramembrane serine protease [Candidatus Brocadiia bacterium]|nr:MAG: rhomboid family intramembrane serine protease [Candidatus Brocadiia bacterium]
MLLPIRTNIRPWRTPYANYALIIANLIVFFLQFHQDPSTHQIVNRSWVEHFMLNPARPYLSQFITYAFLHGGFVHILGNMFFLYIFGNNVNDKLGHIGYLCLYLAGAVFSGIGHAMMSSSPVLGASGAVAAVTGAYLVLFPQTLITVAYWFIFIGTVEVPALYFIALKMIFLDNIITRSTENVAYDAHISGYAFGILSMVGLLATGLISSSDFDLWAMIRMWNRRRVYRDSVSSGYDPYTGQLRKEIRVKQAQKSSEEERKEEKILAFRAEIGKRISEHNLSAAAGAYLDLITIDREQVPPFQYLLDIANQLASENKPAESAEAYEKFLANYKSYEYSEQVQLMLGILYSRYLGKAELAKIHLQAALGKLKDPGQIKMCKTELGMLDG